jgi:hypothetical protein
MAKWFVNRNGKQAGPFVSSQLKQLATDGKIRPDDLVRREDQESWHKADSVKGLLIKNGNGLSTTEAPPSLPKIENQGPPPLPDTTPSSTKYPWNHPVSLLIYVLCFGGMYFFAQQRQANRESFRKAGNQAAAKGKDREMTGAPKTAVRDSRSSSSTSQDNGWMRDGKYDPSWMKDGKYDPNWMKEGKYDPPWMKDGKYDPPWMKDGKYDPSRR